MTTIPPNLHKPHDNNTWWLLRRIWDRVNKHNEHFMGVIVGREGSGKSHTAIRLCSELDPTFTHERVIFDVIELLKVLKNGEHEPGNFYMLDEVGVQLGRRTWQERSQVLANQALQLIRDHNLGLIFTLPRMSELDSQTEGRLQALYELTKKEDGEYVAGKWKWMDPDRVNSDGKIYRKYPRRRKGNYVCRITEIAFKPPTPTLVDPYHEAKREFQNEFYQEVIDRFEGEDGGEDDHTDRTKEVVKQIKDGRLPDVVSVNNHTNKPYINRELIRVEFGLTESQARAVKAILERDFDGPVTEKLGVDIHPPNSISS